MTETEREIELVSGTIGGITQKKADTWTVAVTPEGSQYAKNLWTKSADLVEALQAKLGDHGAFVCSASYWTMNDGKQVRSLWIQSEADEYEQQVPDRILGTDLNKPRTTPVPAAKGYHAEAAAKVISEGMSKEDWARKDSAIHKMACIKTAADALKHTIQSEPTTESLNKFNERVLHLALAWHRSVLAERDDPAGEDVPF